MSKETSIMDLDDYSLSHLFSFLPMEDMVRVGDCCLRFKSIIGPLIGRHQFRHGFHKVDDLEKFYTDYGEFIKNISSEYVYGVHDHDNDDDDDYDHEAEQHDDYCQSVWFFDLVTEFCPNLEIVSILNYNDSRTELLAAMCASCNNIKHLRFRQPNWLDDAYEPISGLKNLELLDTHNDYTLTGKYLNRLTSLKELNLDGCYFLESNHFIEICKANKLLKLNIRKCEDLNTEAFRILVETQTELEEIAVDTWYKDADVAQVAHLENLRKVRIRYWNDGIGDPHILLKKLSEHRPSSIKCLSFSGGWYPDCSDGFERIMKFKNLEELRFFRGGNLNDSLLTEISKTCKLLQRLKVHECPGLTPNGIPELIRNLKCLTELHMIFRKTPREELYQDMCEARRTLDCKKKLKVHVSDHFLDNLTVTEEQYNMNLNLVQLFNRLVPFNVTAWNRMRGIKKCWYRYDSDWTGADFIIVETCKG